MRRRTDLKLALAQRRAASSGGSCANGSPLGELIDSPLESAIPERCANNYAVTLRLCGSQNLTLQQLPFRARLSKQIWTACDSLINNETSPLLPPEFSLSLCKRVSINANWPRLPHDHSGRTHCHPMCLFRCQCGLADTRVIPSGH